MSLSGGTGEPRRVAQRVLRTALLLQQRPRRPYELIGGVTDALGEAAYGSQPIFALRRDIQCLRDAGFGVVFARRSGEYQLDQSPLTLRLGNTLVEALAMVRDAFRPGIPHSGDVRELVSRIAALLPADERRLLQRSPAVRVDMDSADASPRTGPRVAQLERAVRRGVQVRFRYRSPRQGTPTDQHVEPRELVYRRGHLYLLAYSLDVAEVREYRVDRIEEGTLEILSIHSPPGRGSPRHYRLRYRLGSVVARLGVSERFPGQHVEMLDDGSALVSAEIESLFWAERTLLAYGEHAEVLEPPELRDRIRKTIERMLAAYDSSAPRKVTSAGTPDPLARSEATKPARRGD